MKTTKLLSILLACVMVLGLVLTGCGEVVEEYSYYSVWEYDDEGNIVDSSDDSTASEGDDKDTSSKKKPSDGKTSSNKSSGDKVIAPSFTQNEDGTSKDKETGVTFLDDDLNDWSKAYDHGKGLQFDANEAALFESDTSRVVRAGATDSWFTYKLTAGITEFGVVTFWSASEEGGTFKDTLSIYVSPDNKTWTKLSGAATVDSPLGAGWIKRVYKYKGIDKSNIYLKVEIGYAEGVYGPNPNISRLRINNIDKMDDEDRYLEGRASATFYVDPKNGSDNNDGKSEAKAFKSLYKVSSKYYQPGDKILFKAGGTFSGALVIKGYGEKDNPITVGTYGGDGRAKISARGGNAVTVNAKNIVVKNLEVTNPKGFIGIYVLPYSVGQSSNITVENCYVHDVNTSETRTSYENGGIIVYVDGAEPTWLDNVHIKNNVVEKVCRTGILLTTQWAYRPGRWGHTGHYKNDNDGWWPFTNCTITGNTVSSTSGDGIMVCGAKGILIEKNTVNNAYATKKPSNGMLAVAALWTTNTNDSVIQYNDVGHTNLPSGGGDGEGFDIDISEINTTIQYNYSHDNAGGFLLLCNFADGNQISKNHTIRYNLSVNDASHTNRIITVTEGNPNTHIYNNTFYMGVGGAQSPRTLEPVYHFGGKTTDLTFTNNIFYGETYHTFKWANDTSAWGNVNYVNNVFYNTGVPQVAGVTVSEAKTDDPQFANKAVSPDSKRAEVIAGFTPKNKIAGASAIANNGGKDISGASIGNSNFYGCVKY